MPPPSPTPGGGTPPSRDVVVPGVRRGEDADLLCGVLGPRDFLWTIWGPGLREEGRPRFCCWPVGLPGSESPPPRDVGVAGGLRDGGRDLAGVIGLSRGEDVALLLLLFGVSGGDVSPGPRGLSDLVSAVAPRGLRGLSEEARAALDVGSRMGEGIWRR